MITKVLALNATLLSTYLKKGSQLTPFDLFVSEGITVNRYSLSQIYPLYFTEHPYGSVADVSTFFPDLRAVSASVT
jgi:hypothetical protein